ncbi:MAG: ATP-dependent DNA ligase [Gemmataceae bacterium]|nr:ATP-dependent DNA ligase [Gemmataceae bacterium]
MKAFADLYAALDETNKTSEKVAALVRYFAAADPADAAWAVYFLIGRKPKQVVPSRRMREWAVEAAGVPQWLFEESYHAVGDIAETIALLLPESGRSTDRPLHEWVEQRLLPLRKADEAKQKASLLAAWAELDARQRFVWNKLITGEFRVGVSQLLVTRALAEVTKADQPAVAHRLMGDWQPTPEFYRRLVGQGTADADASRPYPFFLATPIDPGTGPEVLGDVADWFAEWKWDGIRSQLIRRGGQVYLWSRGEELITDRFPEITDAGRGLPDGTVIDGEVLPWGPAGVRPFADLQKRITRKTLTKKILADIPAVLLAYDLLEWEGRDVRTEPMTWRRGKLEEMVGWEGEAPAEPSVAISLPSPARREPRPPGTGIRLSPLVAAPSWEELTATRAEARGRNVEGFMLKRKASPYRVGRVRGDWWKWKVDPYSVDAVLIYAQRGSGKRASLYSDYAFGVWDGGRLVPFAKAYSGLTDAELREVDAFIRRNTTEAFGPVRTVKPELVFEVGFEGIQRSTRHKSGVAVRFPRILRQRKDKAPADADTLEAVRRLLPPGSPAGG